MRHKLLLDNALLVSQRRDGAQDYPQDRPAAEERVVNMNDVRLLQALQELGVSPRLGPDVPDEPNEGDTEGDVLTAPAEPKLKKPPMYKVVILNDDFTPMEFVVHILESFFVLSREKATQIMLSIHTTGSGVAGIFPRDIAETKSEQVNQYAQENNHPLMSTVEMTD